MTILYIYVTRSSLLANNWIKHDFAILVGFCHRTNGHGRCDAVIETKTRKKKIAFPKYRFGNTSMEFWVCGGVGNMHTARAILFYTNLMPHIYIYIYMQHLLARIWAETYSLRCIYYIILIDLYNWKICLLLSYRVDIIEYTCSIELVAVWLYARVHVYQTPFHSVWC